jgi:hypothetical protein
MYTVEEVMGMGLTTLMVTIVVVLVTGEVVNPRLTSKLTMLTDINLTQRGVQVETVPDLVQEVPEVEKESW